MDNPFEQEYMYRASELGACIKRLVAARMGEKRTESVPASIQAAFDRGNAHEIACLAMMRSEGWEVWGEQEELIVPVGTGTINVEITGHPDCMTRPPWVHQDLSFVGEIKSPTAWGIFDKECLSAECSPLTEHYKWQLSFYMVTKRAQGMMICLDENFKIKYRVFEEPFYTWQDILARVVYIEELAQQRKLPRLCSIRDFPCPFVHLHVDDEMQFTEDSALDILVERYHAAKEREKAIKDELDYVKRTIVDHLGEQTEVTTPSSRVSLYRRKSVSYDYDRMRHDGLPVDDYKTEQESDWIPRITYKGE